MRTTDNILLNSSLVRSWKMIILIMFLFYLPRLTSAQCTTCHEGHSVGPYPPSSPNGSGSMGLSYLQENVCGLNYTTASVETTTRPTWQPGTGFPTTMTVSTLPASCIKIDKAFLYWGASYTESSAPTVTVTIKNPLGNSNTYSSTNVGTASQVCWGEIGTVGYRADVTSSISGNGTYTLNLTGFVNAASEVDGMTLIIIYTSPNSYSGSIAIWDGCMATFTGSPLTQTLGGFSACDNGAGGSAFGMYGDMQNNISPNTNTETFNGSTGSFSNSFWNTNVVNTNVTAGQTSCVFNSYTNNTNDCFLWIGCGLYWQNTTCLTCTVSPLNLTMNQVNPDCGKTIGSANVIISGGASPYAFTWSNGETGDTATGLAAGTYTVKVKDAFCDSAVDSVKLLPASPPVIPTASVLSNAKCNSASNGEAVVTVSSGTNPFSYSWSPIGGTTTHATGLSAGTYTVTVTDSVGCTGTATVLVKQPAVLADSIVSKANVSCNGSNNGNALVGVKGGTSPYNYAWSDGETAANATNLSAGTYTVNVTDSNGCFTSAKVSIGQPSPMKLAIGPVINPACSGGNNGSANVNASNGTPPYAYNWSSGATNANATGLSAGTYSVTVTDSNGCTITASAVLKKTAPMSNINTINNLYCNGANTGSVTVSTSGGLSPYNYSWTSGATSSTVTGLTAGTYVATITDSNGCASFDTVKITQPPPINIKLDSAVMPMCYGDTSGSITITASGGSFPYVYSWSPSGGNNYVATGLASGTYVITVEDNSGCINSDTIKLGQPAKIMPVVIGSDSICIGDSITLTASGGGTYNWSPGSNTNSSIRVSPTTSFTYTLTATKGNCSADTTFTVFIKQHPTITLAGKDSVCKGDSVMLKASGGTAYSWSNGKTQDSIWVSPITNTTYSVQVTKGGCASDTTVTITVVTPVAASIKKSTDSICPGTNVLLTASGGGNYKWSTGSTSSTILVSPKSTTTYSVLVSTPCSTDTMRETIHVIPFTGLSFSGSTSVCKGQSTTITASGGLAYNWSNGANSASITVTDTVNTTYTLTVSNGKCTIDTTITITILPGPTVTITSPQHLCPGDSVMLTAGGGGTYLWNNGSTNSSIWVKPASTSSYSVTVSNGCPGTANTSVNVDVPTLNACCDATIQSGQSANLNATDAVSYTWAPADGLSCTTCPNPVATPTATTTYTVTGIDSAGCTVQRVITIEVSPCEDFDVPNVFTPNGDGQNDVLAINIKSVDTYTLRIYDRWGKMIFTTNSVTDSWDGKSKNGSMVPDGVYYYELSAACGNNTYNKHGYVEVLK